MPNRKQMTVHYRSDKPKLHYPPQHTVRYAAEGNVISAYLNGNELSFAYDSANRLISAGQNSYTYSVEDVRVRNLCGESEQHMRIIQTAD